MFFLKKGQKKYFTPVYNNISSQIMSVIHNNA